MARRVFVIGIIVLVLALSLTLPPACGNGNGDENGGVTPTPGITPTPGVTPAPGAKTLKIGCVSPLSGPAAPWGVPYEEGAIWAAADINKAGGIKVGQDRYMVEIISCDSKFSGEAGALCASEFAYDRGLHWSVGGISAAVCRAMRPIFHENKVVNVTVSGSVFSGPDWPYWLNGTSHYPTWATNYWSELTKFYPEVEMAAFIHLDTADTLDQFEQIRPNIEAMGVTVTHEAVQQGTVDFYPVLTRILREDIDVLDTWTMPAGSAALIVKQARELGYTGLISNTAWSPLHTLVGTAGLQYMYNMLTSLHDYESGFFGEAMIDLFHRWQVERAKPGETDMPGTLVNGYRHVMFYRDAIEEAGSIDPDDVLKVFDDPTFEFEAYFTPDGTLGGLEMFGISRYLAHYVPFGRIVVEGGEAKVVQMGGAKYVVP